MMMESKADHDEYNICNVCPSKNPSCGLHEVVCYIYIPRQSVRALQEYQSGDLK